MQVLFARGKRNGNILIPVVNFHFLGAFRDKPGGDYAKFIERNAFFDVTVVPSGFDDHAGRVESFFALDVFGAVGRGYHFKLTYVILVRVLVFLAAARGAA